MIIDIKKLMIEPLCQQEDTMAMRGTIYMPVLKEP